MEGSKILDLIDEAIFDHYLQDNYKLDGEFQVNEPQEHYGDKYKKLAKQILFNAKLAANKANIAKVISITEAKGRLQELNMKHQGKVFSIFKKHIEEYGLAANYRNFDTMNEEEMSSILEQINFTKLFDEIQSDLENE